MRPWPRASSRHGGAAASRCHPGTTKYSLPRGGMTTAGSTRMRCRSWIRRAETCWTTCRHPTTFAGESGRAVSNACLPYATALVAQHALHLFDKYRSDPGWWAFRTDGGPRRQPGRAAPRTEDERRLLLRPDGGSAICNSAMIGATQRHADFESRWDGAQLTITPDPFEGASVPMMSQPDGSQNTVRGGCDRSAFSDAPIVTISGVAARRGCVMTRFSSLKTTATSPSWWAVLQKAVLDRGHRRPGR